MAGVCKQIGVTSLWGAAVESWVRVLLTSCSFASLPYFRAIFDVLNSFRNITFRECWHLGEKCGYAFVNSTGRQGPYVRM